MSSKMSDKNLIGTHKLWEKKQLFDFTIVAEDQEIRAHRVVLACQSEYFNKLLCEEESCTYKVKLNDLSANAVSKTIEYIYTRNHDMLKNNTTDILEGAIYFQVPDVVESCKKVLKTSLTATNCCNVLSIFTRYALHKEAEEVAIFIRYRWNTVVTSCSLREISFEGLQILMDCWERSEWTLFLYIRRWVNHDFETRKVHMNKLMSKVRFCLIPPGKIAAIKEMNDVLTELDKSCCALVDKAEVYHQRPTHLKVLNNSTQNTVRNEPEPVLIATCGTESESTMYTLKKGYNKAPPEIVKRAPRTLDEKRMDTEAYESSCCMGAPVPWENCKVPRAPDFTEVRPEVIEINNFMIVCNGHGRAQRWYIFDPRNMTWTDMPLMLTSNSRFAMVHYDQTLYTLGGEFGSEPFRLNSQINSINDEVQEYKFQTNTWRRSKQMPARVTRHAACTFGDAIFVSGGVRFNKRPYPPTKDMDCLDVKTGKWIKKAPMSKAAKDHKMYIMMLNKKKVIVVIEQMNFQYYHPDSDQWTEFHPDCSMGVPNTMLLPEWSSDGVVLANGNALFLLNIFGYFELEESCRKRKKSRYGDGPAYGPAYGCAFDSDFDSDCSVNDGTPELERSCVRWELPETGNYGRSIQLKVFTENNDWSAPSKDFCAALLALGERDCCPGGRRLCDLCQSQAKSTKRI